MRAGLSGHRALLDIGMPDLSGYEVAGRLRKGPVGDESAN